MPLDADLIRHIHFRWDRGDSIRETIASVERCLHRSVDFETVRRIFASISREFVAVRQQITLVECQRCSAQHQFETKNPDEAATRWGVAALHAGLDGINASDIVDLCPKCVDELDAWLLGLKK